MYGAVAVQVRNQRKKSLTANASPRKGVKKTPARKPKGGAAAPSAPTHQPSKLPNGKAAWENEKDKQKAKAQDANVRWMHKNKVGDSSQEGGGNLEKLPNGKYRQTGVVNVVLYVGLGLISIGLIVTFVGMGERGFKTNELKLIGPSLIGCGLLFSILRILFCSCPKCGDCKKTQSLDEKALLAPSQESLAEEANEGPRPEPDGEESDGAPERHFTSKSARTVRSHHPNYIDDEVEDDEVLGLNVDYMDETIRGRDGSAGARSRRLSEDSNDSVASKVPKLPEIHAATSKNGNELVLNPAKLGGVGD